MNRNSKLPTNQEVAYPDNFTRGSTVLIASAGNPSEYALDLHALSTFGEADDTALIVTTTGSADDTIETYDRLCPDENCPRLKLVDTTTEQQSVSALYEETPVVFTPSPDDLERLILALSELSGATPPRDGARHLAIRSLTPILDTTPTDRVCRVLERIQGLRSPTGLCLIGFDYTAHDQETLRALASEADGVLWVSQATDGRIEVEYQSRGDRHTSPAFDVTDVSE